MRKLYHIFSGIFETYFWDRLPAAPPTTRAPKGTLAPRFPANYPHTASRRRPAIDLPQWNERSIFHTLLGFLPITAAPGPHPGRLPKSRQYARADPAG